MSRREPLPVEIVGVPTGTRGVFARLHVMFRLGNWAVTTTALRVDEQGVVLTKFGEPDDLDATPAITYLGPGPHHGAKACHGALVRVLREFIETRLGPDATPEQIANELRTAPYAISPDKSRHLWVGRAGAGWRIAPDQKRGKAKNIKVVSR